MPLGPRRAEIEPVDSQAILSQIGAHGQFAFPDTEQRFEAMGLPLLEVDGSCPTIGAVLAADLEGITPCDQFDFRRFRRKLEEEFFAVGIEYTKRRAAKSPLENQPGRLAESGDRRILFQSGDPIACGIGNQHDEDQSGRQQAKQRPDSLWIGDRGRRRFGRNEERCAAAFEIRNFASQSVGLGRVSGGQSTAQSIQQPRHRRPDLGGGGLVREPENPTQAAVGKSRGGIIHCKGRLAGEPAESCRPAHAESGGLVFAGEASTDVGQHRIRGEEVFSMGQDCAYCGATEIVEDEHSGVLRCHECGRSSLPNAASAKDSARLGVKGAVPPFLSAHSRRRREKRGAPGEIPSWPAALSSLAATGLFYGLLGLLPASGFSVLFTDRGWVPYVITLISVWALFLLGAKLRRLQKERAMLERDLVVVGEDGLLGPDDAASALAALSAQPPEVTESFLVRRLERALRHFQSRRHSVEIVEFLAIESRSDEGRVDASYGLVRVFVWAVPTLGFIGTVIGIGAAVAGFSDTLEAASSLEGMKESIGLVTGGLGVAFDTTLLALVMSILIMFPATAVQRIEEAFIGEVDDYCAAHLIARLRDESTAEADELAIAGLARRLVASMRASEHRGA